MKHSFSRRKKIFLSVTAGVVLVVFLAGAAGAAYISGKMDLLSRPSAGQGGSSQSGTDPGDAVLSFDGMDLSGIDVMENGGSIAPPEGGVNINSGVINVLLIGSDERENSADGSARADSIMMLSVDSRKNTWKLVSFERGVGVSIPNRGDDWLTHTYAYGGANLLMKTLQEYFKVDVSRYVKIDFSGSLLRLHSLAWFPSMLSEPLSASVTFWEATAPVKLWLCPAVLGCEPCF